MFFNRADGPHKLCTRLPSRKHNLSGSDPHQAHNILDSRTPRCPAVDGALPVWGISYTCSPHEELAMQARDWRTSLLWASLCDPIPRAMHHGPILLDNWRSVRLSLAERGACGCFAVFCPLNRDLDWKRILVAAALDRTNKYLQSFITIVPGDQLHPRTERKRQRIGLA